MSESNRQPQTSTEIKDHDKTIQKFLEHVVRGQQNEVKKMLKIDPSLAFKKGKITDYSGRQFIGIGDEKEGISGFQYALWALDTDMWLELLPKIKDRDLGIDNIAIDSIPEIAKQQLQEVKEIGLTYIPPTPVSDEEKDRIKNEDETEQGLIKEMMAAEKKGDPFFDRQNPMSIMLSYHSKSNLKTEKEYDFQIIKALETYVAYVEKTHEVVNTPSVNNWVEDYSKEAVSIWQHIVGGAQLLVPVHVANQYCDISSFEHPTFDTSNVDTALTRRIVKCFMGYAWFPLENEESRFRLGVNCGVTKGYGRGAILGIPHTSGSLSDAELDLKAMTTLCKVRHQDLETLIARLLSPKKNIKA